MGIGGKDGDGGNDLTMLPSDEILVWVSDEFRQKALQFLTQQQLNFVTKEMAFSFFSGVFCERTELLVKSFPNPVQVAVPPKFKIFYSTGRIDQQLVIGLIKTGIPHVSIGKKVTSVAGEVSYVAGRFFDGVYGISGKS